MIYFIPNNHAIYNCEEIITEQSIYNNSVKKNKGYLIFSDVQVNRNFEINPYIKVYNNLTQKAATAVVRISMVTGGPLTNEHTNHDKDVGKSRLKFTKEVAKFLEDAMNKAPNCYKYPPEIKTVYDAIYYDINRAGINCNKFPIPNFMENIEK